jgi:beta-galactosidase
MTTNGFSVKTVSPISIRTGGLKDYDVVMFSGESGSDDVTALQEAGCVEVSIIEFMKLSGAAIFFVLVALAGASPVFAATFAVGESDFLLDGKPFQIRAGEMHPARIPAEYWPARLKLAHAMGLNAVSLYVFWNRIERRPSEFDFTGNNDVARFVQLAQQEGLWVILRPGPYVCGEWDFGGLPWWLLKEKDIKVRSKDARYLAASARYLNALGAQLAPLQIIHGGPIIMVQVENEYGSFASDHQYMNEIRDLDRAAGFDVPLFTADGGDEMMAKGSLPTTLPGFNGGEGPDIRKQISVYRPNGPWLVPEFYPGSLDHWGEPHAHVGTDDLVRETEWKLIHNVSFCYYMIHGGTSFGFMNGANYSDHYQPQPSSYDFEAPIDEAGRPTSKYFYLREAIARHLGPSETILPVPLANPTMAISRIDLPETASVFDNLPAAVTSSRPLSFEDLDQGYGYVLYRAKVEGPVDTNLNVGDLRDFAVVCLDQKRVGTLDSRFHQNSIPLHVPGHSATLDILVENCGRINYGTHMVDGRKGIIGPVTLGGKTLSHWQMFKLPFDNVSEFRFTNSPATQAPCLRRGTFEVKPTDDTFLDLHTWGKGVVFVNGRNLGRYWNIGPQQTLYLPGVWLQKGTNQIVIFDEIKDNQSSLAGLVDPVLNQLNEEAGARARPVTQ